MMSPRTIPLLAVGVLAGAAGSGLAQAPPPLTQPTVSPYLNLARRGSPAGINYYNLVRPQFQLYGSVQQLQQQVGTNRQDIAGVQQSLDLPPTGHAIGFMTQGQYFMTMGQSNVRGGPGAAGGIRPPVGAQPGASGALVGPNAARPQVRRR